MEKDLLDQLIEEGCVDAERYFECGVVLANNGLLERAIEAWTKVIELMPNEPITYVNRGSARAMLDQKEMAIQDYDKAISLGLEDSRVFANRANLKYKIGQKEAAIQDYNKVITLNPSALTYANLGLIKLELNQKEAAIQDYNKAIELNPDEPTFYSNRGLAKSKIGQKEAAIQDYNKAINLDPENALFYNNRGLAKSEFGQKEAAIQDYNEAINLDPENAVFYNNRGFANAELNQNKTAIQNYNQAIEIDPSESLFFHNRGNAKSDLNQMAEARQDFLRAQSLQDQTPIQKYLPHYLTLWSSTFPAPYLVHQLLTEYPEAQKMTSLHTLAADNARQCRPLLRWQTWAEQQLEGRNLLWFNTFLHLGMGDPITANRLLEDLEKLDENSHKDLALQYWLAQTAQDILHEERDEILAFAATAARALESDDPRQHYYAGRILELANADTEALTAYARATDWWLAAVAAAELAQNGQSGLNAFPQGPNVSIVQPTPEVWLGDLEMAVLFYDLEAAITAQTESGHTFPRFWEIWNTDALVEPLRNWLAEEKEAELKARFAEVLKSSTDGRPADHNIFLKDFDDALGSFEKIRNSLDVVASLASMVDSSKKISASDCARFIEYFYLTGNVPEEEVFYLYFFLVQRRGLSPSTTAAEEGLTEVGKGILETLVKSTVPLLNLFGEPAVAGAAEYLKVLFRQMLSNRSSLLGKPGEPTAYEQFKASFRSHIADTMDVLGSREAFLKQYPIEGFGDLL